MMALWVILVAALALATGARSQTPPSATRDLCAEAPDLILYNGTVLTMDPGLPAAEAIALKAGTILGVGTLQSLVAPLPVGCRTRMINLQGLTILPGFNDSHEHWFSWRQHICSAREDTVYPPLEEIMGMLSRHGWTSVSELNFGRPDFIPEHLANALDLDARGELSVRVNGYWGTYDDPSLIDVLADSGISPRRVFTDRIRVPGVKMYVDDPFGTTDIMTQQQVSSLVSLAHARGWQVAAHAVNQTAVEKFLSAVEQVLGSETNAQYRHRIEHAVKVSDDQLQRMKARGIIASFQLMGPPDWPEQATFQTYISNSNPEWCLRWRDFDDAVAEGLHTTGSTDAPFNDAPCDYSPFRVIHQAVTRQGYLNRAHADWELVQRIGIETGIRLLTIDGAYATFEEHVKGSLSPGKLADLVVVSDNPLNVSDPDDLLDIRTRLTMVGGEVEYCDAAAQPSLCDPVEGFRTDSAMVLASSFIADLTPDRAFDGNPETVWSAGSHPPQWLDVDLLEGRVIDRIELQIAQDPAGRTVHQIWARGGTPSDPPVLLREFDGTTQDGQVLSFAPGSTLPPYRHLRVLTTMSPSWVAWEEIRIHTRGVTGVGDIGSNLPFAPRLVQNYPNPFNASTTIHYELPWAAHVRLEVHDVLGRPVAILVDERQERGRHAIRWEAIGYPSGVYVLRFDGGAGPVTARMVLVR
jgi:predicted amidohydrolase YtcJ